MADVEFTEPVVVTRVDFEYLENQASRSGGVAVTGATGGYGLIRGGQQQTRDTDWGKDCEDCPKGGSITFTAIDGMPFGNASWGVDNIIVYGCTKTNSKHNHRGKKGWSHDHHTMRNAECPSGYHDEDADGVCELCLIARECGPGRLFNGTMCSTSKDNTCTACTKPIHAKYGKVDGSLTHGSCEFVCTDSYTGSHCNVSNACTETSAVLGDAHGDGWNGAEAHIDALTGPDQWTFVAHAQFIEGEGTATATPTNIMKAIKPIGCLKDGCYSFHFEDVGAFPSEVMIFGSTGMTDASDVILTINQLHSTEQKFWFIVINGNASGANTTMCDPTVGFNGNDPMPFVQLGAEPTLAPGVTYAGNQKLGELASNYELH